MYIHSHLRISKDIITFVYCTYRHMLQRPWRFKDTLFFFYNVRHKQTCVCSAGSYSERR